MKNLNSVTLKVFLTIIIVSNAAEVPDKPVFHPGYLEALNSTIINLILQLQVYTKYLDQSFQPLQTYDKVFPQKLSTFKAPDKPSNSAEEKIQDVPNTHKDDTGDEKTHITEPVTESVPAGEPVIESYDETSAETEFDEEESPDVVPPVPSQVPDIRENITANATPEPAKTETDDDVHFDVPGDTDYGGWFDVDVRFGDSSSDSLASSENRGSAKRKILPEYPNCGVQAGDTEGDMKESQVALGTQEEHGFSLTCGGTLISPTAVLTSASLLMNENVTVARTHYSGLNRIAQVILHPRYMPGSIYNDLAIIKLAVPVDVVPESLPCVPSATSDSKGKWFSTEWKYVARRGALSLNAKQVPGNVVPSSNCGGYYRKYFDIRELDFKLSFPRGIDKSLQCFSAVEQRQCEFKKGDQLLRKSESQGSWNLVGTRVNMDFYCDDYHLPGVYTNTNAFKDWIAENL